jgi:hypothetical protein
VSTTFVRRVGTVPLFVLVGVQACGQVAGDAAPPIERHDSGAPDATPDSARRDAGEHSESGDVRADSDTEDAGSTAATPYSGSITASLTSGGRLYYELFAAFEKGPLPPFSSGCNGGSAGNCCPFGLPGYLLGPFPTAGNITIERGGAPFATFPAPVSPQSSYSAIVDAMWDAGDSLDVSATGGEVDPFSGTLETPTLPSGVSPAFGPDSFVITRSSNLRVSWTPDARDGETIQFGISVGSTTNGVAGVACAVPDSDGFVVVDASLLGPLAVGPNASVYLTRVLTSVVSAPNAIITLNGESSISGPATVQ